MPTGGKSEEIMTKLWCPVALLAWVAPTVAEWRMLPPQDQRQALPSTLPADTQPIRPGDPWPSDNKFRWLVSESEIPARIDGKPVKDQPVGLRLSCGDGGEVLIDGRLQTRYDNDHPALVVLTDRAEAGAKVSVAVQVYGKVQGGDRFDEAALVLLDPRRVRDRLDLHIHPDRTSADVPKGLAGLSQGGGLADYNDDTARKLRDGGFRWFRMDNVLTGVVRRSEDDRLMYDWTDFDRRVDFIAGKMGADPILAVSYMPQAFDAVPDPDRHSAPKDYALWEDLCYRAARRCIERGHRVPYWEVWNEVNSGWLKPGPQDTGGQPFKDLYKQALGREETDAETIRRFEAYCKLYRATARGILKADPQARIGGPALASGPFETQQYGHCVHGKGFARGLMIWCQQEKLPLDFVSWHEYFQPADVIRGQAEGFREYLAGFPELKRSVRSFMITEWNEAWWPDRPQDHEIGAAYCADCIIRAFIPAGIDRPCFFYVKQNDMNFRGDYSLLMANNVPKASYNVLKVFNSFSGRWVAFTGGDGEVTGVAAWDESRSRLAIVLVNFLYRHGIRRHVRLGVDPMPASLARGTWRESVVDGTRSNIWNDPDHPDRAELTETARGVVADRTFSIDRTLEPYSVSLIELTRPGQPN
jgi:hypothetical protein